MQLIFLGTGSAFTVGEDNYNSNMMLVDPTTHAKLLIDCGSDVRHALHRLHYSYKDITDVYISHLHADHAGGLEWLGLTSKFDPKCHKPNLYANLSIIKDVWNRTLSGGMTTLQDREAELTDFFEVHPIDDNQSFFWQSLEFQTIAMKHTISHHYQLPSYGLLFTIHNVCIFLTTDTQFEPSQLSPFYQKADIIFHDCETASVPSTVHARFEQLIQLNSKIKAKMWLYHYNPGPLPDAKAHGFLGFIKRGQVFEF